MGFDSEVSYDYQPHYIYIVAQMFAEIEGIWLWDSTFLWPQNIFSAGYVQ